MNRRPAKGPWRLQRSSDGKRSEIISRDRRICEPVAIIPHDDITEEGEICVTANIDLLLAAPDLLQALLAVRTRCDGSIFTTDQQTGETFDKLMDAAIAKATPSTELRGQS